MLNKIVVFCIDRLDFYILYFYQNIKKFHANEGVFMDKIRVLIKSDYLSHKVYDIERYNGDGEGDSYYVDSLTILSDAESRGVDLYFIDGEIQERSKNPNEYYNQLSQLREKCSKIKEEEKRLFSEYISGQYGSNAKDKLFDARQKLLATQQTYDLLVENRKNQVKNSVQQKISATNFKYYCSICLIIKDENEYLEEWLRWYIALGIEHFYIYDHESKQPVAPFVKSLGKDISNLVTVIRFEGKHDFAQHDAYNDCLNKFATESRWIGFFDSDEMLRILEEGKTLKDILQEFENDAGLFIGWKLFGANGQIKKSSRPVRERFTTIVAPENNNQQGVGKLFAQAMCIRQMLTHNGYPIDGFEVVDENHEKVKRGVAWEQDLPIQRICLDHFYTKSYEEWVEKMLRGTCDPYYTRKYAEFFVINPDLKDCQEAKNFEQQYEISKK